MAALQGGLNPRLSPRIGGRLRRAGLGRLAVLGAALVLLAVLILGPLAATVMVSFWQKQGLGMRPGFTLASYAVFFAGVRLEVLMRTIWVAVSATALMLPLAYMVAWVIAFRLPDRQARIVLFLLAVPFLVNYVVRTFAWSDLLSRTGPINRALQATGVIAQPADWLLYSDFAVYLGLITAYMPFMIFPIWLALKGIDQRYLEASWILGEPPLATFWRVTLPLSAPGVVAALIFGLVGCFGEVAVPLILGGTGYQLVGNAITSALDVLNFPLAAAMSSVAIAAMLLLLLAWYRLFDLRLFLGRMLGRA